jgi:hypothetical protein
MECTLPNWIMLFLARRLLSVMNLMPPDVMGITKAYPAFACNRRALVTQVCPITRLRVDEQDVPSAGPARWFYQYRSRN